MKKFGKPRSCLNNRAERRGVTESVIKLSNKMLGTDTPGHVRQQIGAHVAGLSAEGLARAKSNPMLVIRQILGSPTAERKRGVLSVLADGRSAWARWAALAFSLAAAKSVFAEPTTLPPVSSGGAAAAGNGDFIISASKHSSEGGLLPGYDAYLKLRPDGSQISYHALATRAGDETTGGGLGLEGENWRLGGYQSDYFIDPESELGESLAADGVDLSKRAITAGAVNGYLNHQTVSGGSHQFGFEFVNGKPIHDGLEDAAAARDRFGYGYERIFDGSTVERVIFSLTGQQETAGFGDPELNIEEPLARKYSSGSIAAGLVASITEKCKLALGLVAHNGTTLGARGEDGLPVLQTENDAGMLAALGCYQDSASSSAYSGILGYDSSDNTVSGAGSVGPFTLDFSYQKGQDGQPDEQKVALGFQRALTANSTGNGSVRKNGVADFIRGLFKMPSKKYALQNAAAAARNIASIVPTAAKQEETPDADEFNNAIASSDTPNVSPDGTVINGFFDFETEITQAGIDDGNYTATSADGNLTIGTLELDQLGNLIVPYSLADDASVVAGDKVGLTLTWPTGNSQVFEITVEAAEAGVPTLVSAEGQGITAGTAVASNAETTINGATFTLENLPEGTTGNDITLVSSDGIVISGDNFMLSEDLSTATVDIFVPALAEGEYTVTLRVFLGDGAYQDTGTFTITTAENAEVLPTATYTGPTTATANEAFTASYSVSGVADGKTHEDFRIIANGDTANPISGALSATSFSASVALSESGTVELQYLNSAGSWVTIGSSTSITVETAEVDPTMSDASAGDLTGGTSGSSSASATINYAPDGTTADNFTFGAVAGLIYSNIAFANGTLTFTATNADDLMPGSYSIPVYLNNELLGSITITVETPPDPTVAAGTSVEVQSGETTTVSATLEGVTPVHNATVTVGGVAATLNADGTLTWDESVALQAGTPADETRTVTYNGVEIGTIAVNVGEAAVTQSNVIDLGTAASFATDLSVPASGGEISGALANVPGLATATDISVSYTLPGGVSVTTSVSNLTLNDDGSGTIYINIGEIDNAETGDEIQVSVSIGGVEVGETTANVVVEAGF